MTGFLESYAGSGTDTKEGNSLKNNDGDESDSNEWELGLQVFS